MDSQWFARLVARPGVLSHSAAAIFLASQGADGYHNVELMLAQCKTLNLSRNSFDKCEDILLLSGTLTIIQMVRNVGYDGADPLHRDLFTWIDGLTNFVTAKIRGAGVWGYGDLGTPPESVSSRLIELVKGQRIFVFEHMNTIAIGKFDCKSVW